MLRAVLDANVVVSAFLRPVGPSGRIPRAFLERRTFMLIVSEGILDEIRNTLSSPRVRKHLTLSDEEIETRVASLGVLGDVVSGTLAVRAVKDDPDDDKYLAAALEGQAGFVVSGDHHLQDLREFQGVRIVSPREFVDLLESLPRDPEGEG